MADIHLRTLEREALAGDTDAQDRYVAAAKRAGPLEYDTALLRLDRVTGQARCLAYLGDERAREALGWRVMDNGTVCEPCVQSAPFDRTAWRFIPGLRTNGSVSRTSGLLPLLALLPRPKGLTRACRGCLSCVRADTVNLRRVCDGSKRVPLTSLAVDSQQYYAVVIAEAVARKVFSTWTATLPHGDRYMNVDGAPGEPVYLPRDPLILQTLNAVTAWLVEPTDRRLHTITRLVHPPQNRPDWAYQPLRMVYAWDGAARQGLRIQTVSAKDIEVDIPAVSLKAMRPRLAWWKV